jgi:hypothetical protein
VAPAATQSAASPSATNVRIRTTEKVAAVARGRSARARAVTVET